MAEEIVKRLAPAGKVGGWILALCPHTGDEVVGSRWHHQLIPGAQPHGWWYCPACKGWHFQPLADTDDKRYHSEETRLC